MDEIYYVYVVDDDQRLRGVFPLKKMITSPSVSKVTDEIHQLFVPGRSGQITDVILDSCGGLIGAVLSAIILYLIRKRKKDGS